MRFLALLLSVNSCIVFAATNEDIRSLATMKETSAGRLELMLLLFDSDAVFVGHSAGGAKAQMVLDKVSQINVPGPWIKIEKVEIEVPFLEGHAEGLYLVTCKYRVLSKTQRLDKYISSVSTIFKIAEVDQTWLKDLSAKYKANLLSWEHWSSSLTSDKSFELKLAFQYASTIDDAYPRLVADGEELNLRTDEGFQLTASLHYSGKSPAILSLDGLHYIMTVALREDGLIERNLNIRTSHGSPRNHCSDPGFVTKWIELKSGQHIKIPSPESILRFSKPGRYTVFVVIPMFKRETKDSLLVEKAHWHAFISKPMEVNVKEEKQVPYENKTP